MTVLVYDLKSLNALAQWETIAQGLSASEAEDRFVILRKENPKLQIMLFGSTVTNYQDPNPIHALEGTCSSKF